MERSPALDALMADLTADLRPVRRLPPPALRAAAWIALALAMAAGLALFCDLPALRDRLAAEPDMWLAAAASTATAGLAALAAFELSVPGRSARWAVLPLPTLVVWAAAGGLGCLRTWGQPSPSALGPAAEAGHCLTHIVMISLPLMAVMVFMVRRACPLRPNLTSLIAGLAVAAASAALLNFDHPYDASATDLLAHLVAVLLVIGGNQIAARRALPAGPGA